MYGSNSDSFIGRGFMGINRYFRLQVWLLMVLITQLHYVVLAQSAARPLSSAATTQDPYLVGAYYYCGWWREPYPVSYLRSRDKVDWRTLYPEREPVTGWYDDRQELVDAQIQLAAAGGLDFFVFDWYTPRSLLAGAVQNHNNGLKFFLTSPYKRQMKFSVLYVNHEPYGITSKKEWENVTDQWVQFFRDPQYLNLDGRPIFIVFHPKLMQQQWGGSAGVRWALKRLEDKAKSQGFRGVMFGASSIWSAGEKGAALRQFDNDGYDFYTNYGLPAPAVFKRQAARYEEMNGAQLEHWDGINKYSSLPYVPLVTAGYDRRPRNLPDQMFHFVGNSPEKFRKLLETAKETVDHQAKMRLPVAPNGQRMVLIYAWNELAEGGFIIPTKRDGDVYLRQVRTVFGAMRSKRAPKTPPPVASIPRTRAGAASLYEGNHEQANCTSIIGWAWNKRQPNKPVKVDIYDAQTLLGTVTADHFRQDLLKAGKGNGRHAFVYFLTPAMQARRSHSIRVMISRTGIDLKNTPKAFTCAPR